MGTTSSTVRDLTARLSSLREGFKEGSERQRSDPEFIRYYLNKVQELGEDLARAIERGDVKPREHSLDELKEAMGNLTRELSFLLSKANGKRDSEDNENTTAEIAVVFFPKVLKGIEDYKKIAKAAGRDVTIDLQVVVGYMTGKPNATDRWKAFAAQELSEVMAIKPKGEKRDAAIVEWNSC